ncbi:HLA class II histocompatibility antigen, DR beta 5 chain isoform X2 [Amia ocellicauda]
MRGMLYSRRDVFNKMEIIHFDSKIRKHVGYTEYGIRTAEYWNKDKDYMASILADEERYCKHNAEVLRASTLDREVTPSVRVRSSKPVSSRHPVLLVCHVTGFYPQRINVTWLRDGVETSTDVTSTELLANGDWTYQIHSHLELRPRAGERITCRVQHKSLEQPLEVTWDNSASESKKNKVIMGVCGLVLGLIIAAAGVIYYKKKSTGRILVPSD